MIRLLRRAWYCFLGAPRVFTAPRNGHWYVYCDGQWLGPYDADQSYHVESGLRLQLGSRDWRL